MSLHHRDHAKALECDRGVATVAELSRDGASCIAANCVSQSGVLASMSVNRNVTLAAGRRRDDRIPIAGSIVGALLVMHAALEEDELSQRD